MEVPVPVLLESCAPVLAIAGPTASGKSALAVRLARAVGGEVVNADALQVYAELQVLSARPTSAEMEGIPHHLFGHVPATRRYSVGAWTRDALAVLRDLRKRSTPAVLVGGTGLYFHALFRGLAEVPDVDDAPFADLHTTTLRDLAHDLDPAAAARVEDADRQRLLRIVAVARGTGRTLSDWQADTHPLVRDWRGVVVRTERAGLYARIDARFADMMERGAGEEAQGLSALDPALPAARAIGVAHLLSGAPNAVELSQRDTRRLAKRQMTWFRNQTPDWPRVAPTASAADALRAMCHVSRDD